VSAPSDGSDTTALSTRGVANASIPAGACPERKSRGRRAGRHEAGDPLAIDPLDALARDEDLETKRLVALGQQGDVELAGRRDADGVIGDHLVEEQRARGHVAGIVGRDRGTRRFDECQDGQADGR
jgi:hypothetical protein